MEKDRVAFLNGMLNRQQFESFVTNTDLNFGVYKTKNSENKRTVTPPNQQSNSHNSISQISKRRITQSLNSISKGKVREINSFAVAKNEIPWCRVICHHFKILGGSLITGITEFAENESFNEIRQKSIPLLMTIIFAISEKITIHVE